MHFDVIIGNPPYQMTDGGGGGSARPIYQEFVTQAKKLDPRHLMMITPSRWFAGGRGLDQFRSEMLADRRLTHIRDYIVANDAFPNVNINGGVSYFLWSRDVESECEVVTIAPGGREGTRGKRDLGEFDIFIRQNEAVEILRKVLAKNESRFSERVSSLRPFGLRTNFHGHPHRSESAPLRFYGSGKVSWVSRNEITTNLAWIERWKVLVARATDGNEKYPLPIWDQKGPFVAAPFEVCSETYLVASVVDSEAEAEALVAYMNTRFFRFLVSLRKMTQDNKADNFAFVPDLPLDRHWVDADLYERYELTELEVEFIESQIRASQVNHA